jgi:threonine dehydrogenase-like Zn-dependent dehydrogenase
MHGIVIQSPKNWELKPVELDPTSGVLVDVSYAGICQTDLHVIDGSLGYYKKGIAKYPIITGHEWCGYYEGTPVTGLCILKCENKDCGTCMNPRYWIHCLNHKEVGVLNHFGAHASQIRVPKYSLIPLKTMSPKAVFIEPLAVVYHALRRISLANYSSILVNGMGNIGKLCSKVLDIFQVSHDIFDPRHSCEIKDLRDYDLYIECSGSKLSINNYVQKSYGGTILAFGFHYDPLDIEMCMTHEINLVTTLGSSLDDFYQASAMIEEIDIEIDTIMKLEHFGQAIQLASQHKKVIIECQS